MKNKRNKKTRLSNMLIMSLPFATLGKERVMALATDMKGAAWVEKHADMIKRACNRVIADQLEGKNGKKHL